MQPVFRYTHLDTPIHRLHPLVKLLYVLLTLRPADYLWLAFIVSIFVLCTGLKFT
jgi:energy-coupling factor transporter transmembrane protein EcfT